MAGGFDYDGSAATAERLIKRFGAQSTLTRITPGTGPAFDPGAPTELVIPIRCVILPASAGTKGDYDDLLAAGTLTLEHLRRILIAPRFNGADLGTDPRATDVVVVGGRKYALLGCTPLNPAGVAVLYKGACRAI